MWKWGSRAGGRRRGQAAEEAWLRPKAEDEGGTGDGSLLLWGQELLIEGWMGADAGVKSEEVDLDPALKVVRVRRQPGRAVPRHRLEVQAMSTVVLRLCAKHPDARKSLVHPGQPKIRAYLKVRPRGDRARVVALSSARRNISPWVCETCT